MFILSIKLKTINFYNNLKSNLKWHLVEMKLVEKTLILDLNLGQS